MTSSYIIGTVICTAFTENSPLAAWSTFPDICTQYMLYCALLWFVCFGCGQVYRFYSGSLHWSSDHHYNDVIMSAIASQITSLTIVYSIVYSGAYQTKHQSSASLAFVRGIHRWPVNSPHKWPVTRKMFPFDDVIMNRNLLKPILQPKRNKLKQTRVHTLYLMGYSLWY